MRFAEGAGPAGRLSRRDGVETCGLSVSESRRAPGSRRRLRAPLGRRALRDQVRAGAQQPLRPARFLGGRRAPPARPPRACSPPSRLSRPGSWGLEGAARRAWTWRAPDGCGERGQKCWLSGAGGLLELGAGEGSAAGAQGRSRRMRAGARARDKLVDQSLDRGGLRKVWGLKPKGPPNAGLETGWWWWVGGTQSRNRPSRGRGVHVWKMRIRET